MNSQLSGVLTALATPFAADGSIDEAMLRRVVDRSIEGGVDGVVACGSTGEFAAMSGAERRFVVETVIDQTASRVPVVAQTGAMSTAEAVELSRHAEAAGASVLMVVAPYARLSAGSGRLGRYSDHVVQPARGDRGQSRT